MGGRANGAPGPVVGRRTVLVEGAAAVVGALTLGALVGRPTPPSPPATATPRPSPPVPVSVRSLLPVRAFASTRLTTFPVSTWRAGPTAPGLLFVTPQVGTFHGVVMDDAGGPVWIEPTGVNVVDLRAQRWNGQPVLTYWTGTIVAGHGEGHGVILDTRYRHIATVRVGAGLQTDLHEFQLTPAGTALLTAYPTAPADLRPVGGPEHGWIYDCRVQEVDIRTGAVLWDWRAGAHVAVAETYLGLRQAPAQDGTTRARAFDPFHVNSAAPDGAGRVLISMRHTHAVYSVDKRTGGILWRLGGRRGDFALPADAVFAWQHHARPRADGTLTLFDDHLYSGTDGASRGLRFALDTGRHAAVLRDTYAYDRHLGTAMGSVQDLPGGHVLVGWGTDPAVTEFDGQGRAVFEATLSGGSYRAYRQLWAGTPDGQPDITAVREGSVVRVSLSWNGATDVAWWRIRPSTPGDGAPVTLTVPRTGFETTTLVAPAADIVAEAVDATGSVLGRTRVLHV